MGENSSKFAMFSMPLLLAGAALGISSDDAEAATKTTRPAAGRTASPIDAIVRRSSTAHAKPTKPAKPAATHSTTRESVRPSARAETPHKPKSSSAKPSTSRSAATTTSPRHAPERAAAARHTPERSAPRTTLSRAAIHDRVEPKNETRRQPVSSNASLPTTRYFKDICDADVTKGRATSRMIINAETGDIIDVGNGLLNPDAKGSPASVTKKIITYRMLKALRDGKFGPDGPNSGKNTIIKVPTTWYTSAATGEKNGRDAIPYSITEATIEDVLYATNIESSNRGPDALGIALDGSVGNAIEANNALAREWGMTNTNWTSVNGFPGKAYKEHDTTARDMAIFEMNAYRELGDTMEAYNIPSKKLHGFSVKSHNNLIRHKEFYDTFTPGMTSGKTGFDCSGGWSFSGTLKQGGTTYIVVSLGNPTGYGRDKGIQENAAKLLSGDFKIAGNVMPRTIELEIPKIEELPALFKQASESRIENPDTPIKMPSKNMIGFMCAMGLIGYTMLRQRNQAQNNQDGPKPAFAPANTQNQQLNIV